MMQQKEYNESTNVVSEQIGRSLKCARISQICFGKISGICWSLEGEKSGDCHKSQDSLFKPNIRVSTGYHKKLFVLCSYKNWFSLS